MRLEPLHKNQVNRVHAGQHVLQFRFRPVYLVQQSPTAGGGDEDLVRAGETMTVTVLARTVHVEPVMGMLDRRNRQTEAAQQRQQRDRQSRLTASRPTHNAQYVHRFRSNTWVFTQDIFTQGVVAQGAFTPGAFKSAKAPLPILMGHDSMQPLGAWSIISETSKGLEVKGQLLVNDVARAKEVSALVTAGALRGLSIGFITKSATSRKGGGRNIKALELVECSIVAIPMHPGAKITSAKSAAAAIALAEALNRASAALKLKR